MSDITPLLETMSLYTFTPLQLVKMHSHVPCNDCGKYMFVVYIIYWASGASQSSRLNGLIFIYIYIYIYVCLLVTGDVFGPTYKLLCFIWTLWGCPHATCKRKASSEWSKAFNRRLGLLFHSFALHQLAMPLKAHQ